MSPASGVEASPYINLLLKQHRCFDFPTAYKSRFNTVVSSFVRCTVFFQKIQPFPYGIKGTLEVRCKCTLHFMYTFDFLSLLIIFFATKVGNTIRKRKDKLMQETTKYVFVYKSAL